MRLPFIALSLVLLFALAAPAQAKLEICNKTASPFSVAIAYESDTDIVSQGWWTVDPDKCQTVIQGDLTRQYYYHYVKSRALNVEWAGNFNFCTTDDPEFRISGGNGCEDRNFHQTGFRQVDVGSNKDFSLDISMGPTPADSTVVTAPPAAATTTPAVVAPAVVAPAGTPPATTTTTTVTTTTAPVAPAPNGAAPVAPAPVAPAPVAPAPVTSAPVAPAP